MKKNIAIVTGGDSGEYEISIGSAQVVYKWIDRERFTPFLIHIKGKDWTYINAPEEPRVVDKNNFTVDMDGRRIVFDAVFNAIHGTPGENGILAGYFELLGIPYTTCDVLTSAVTFDKHFCSILAASFGAKTATSIILRKGEEYDSDGVIKRVGLPCFVKPNSGGSSVATTKVMSGEALLTAVELAWEADDRVMVETFIPGTEITCGVFVYEGRMMALPLTEIVSKNEFFDYESKYTAGMADEITPARVSEEVARKCSDTSLKLYRDLNCRGIVRFDYIQHEQDLYFLEVNTIPGLSEASIVPQQADSQGISLTALFSALIDAALEKQ